LLKSQRRQLHARIARTLVGRFPAAIEALPELAAHHFTEAGLAGESIGYWRRAGQRAIARSANQEAVSFLENALKGLARSAETRESRELGIDIRCDLRNALYSLAEYGRIERYLQEASTLALSLGDRRRLGWVSAYTSSLYLTVGGDAADAHAMAKRAEDIATALDEVPLYVAARYYLAWASYIAGDYGETERICRALMASLQGERRRERFGVVFPAVQSRTYLSRALAERGEFGEGDACAREAIALAEELDHPFSLSWACLGLAHVKSVQGELPEAAGLLERAADLCRQWKIGAQAPIVLGRLGYVYAWSGRVEEGVQLLRQAVTDYASTAMEHFLSVSIVQLGEAHLLADQVDEARACAERALTLSRRRGERGFEGCALHLLGNIAARPECFDAGAGEARYREALALAGPRGMRPLAGHCQLGLGTLYRRAGDPVRARAHVASAAQAYREMSMSFWLDRAEAALRQPP
jgi:tetratricopeptide (TPR) repeat protein